MLFNFYGSYVLIECPSNNIEMAEDDEHKITLKWLRMNYVPDNTKYMDLAEDNMEPAQCVIMANVEFRVKLTGPAVVPQV